MRRRYAKKADWEPVGLPASVAWSTIAVLILLGAVQEFGRFKPASEMKFAITFVSLILIGALISIGLFLFRRKRDGMLKPARERERAERMLEGEIQAWWMAVIAPVENFFARNRFSPNVITGLSFGFSLTGCIFFCTGWLFLAGWVILLGGTLDILDGRIARKTGRASRQGAFFDSVLDRYGEVLIFLGVAAHFRQSLLLGIVLLALVGSLMVSYMRARAEGLGVACKVGFMQRPERVVFLGFGAIFSSILYMLRDVIGTNLGPHLMWFVLIVIAILSNYTAISRMVYVMRELRKQESEGSTPR